MGGGMLQRPFAPNTFLSRTKEASLLCRWMGAFLSAIINCDLSTSKSVCLRKDGESKGRGEHV